MSWRSGGGHYGWAPLGPSINIGINIGRGGYRIPDMCWNFIPYNNIYHSSYPRFFGNRNRIFIQNTVIINNTYVRNNRTYFTGPRADDIRRRTNQNVTVYNVNRNSRPGASRIDNNTVNIYNPRPTRGAADVNAAPRQVVQGSINRGVVSRDNNMIAKTSRGDNMNTRPSRDGNGINSVQPSRGMESRDGNISATSPSQRIERGSQNQPQRALQGRDVQQASPQQQERTDRVQQMPQRMERGSQDQPQRVSQCRDVQQASPQQRERTERVQQMPQRMERSEPQQQRTERVQQMPQRTMESRPQQQSQPQRVERSQSAPQQRSSGASESRGSRGGENSNSGRSRGGG